MEGRRSEWGRREADRHIKAGIIPSWRRDGKLLSLSFSESTSTLFQPRLRRRGNAGIPLLSIHAQRERERCRACEIWAGWRRKQLCKFTFSHCIKYEGSRRRDAYKLSHAGNPEENGPCGDAAVVKSKKSSLFYYSEQPLWSVYLLCTYVHDINELQIFIR